MFGLRTATALSVLQKTYDESYLTCSTAVYYESQGNEAEAMRCWKQALEQITDHRASRVLSDPTSRSETEKALVDSLRQLEVQCKERIDLLEALRLSRQEASQHEPSVQSQPQEGGLPGQQEQGWIGNGTIPAITYTELSRPAMQRRASAHARSSTSRPDDKTSTSPSRKPVASAPSLSTPEKKASRSSSPEKHTFRTTLRPGRLGEKTLKTSLWRPPPRTAERPGANKAAILAWSSLSQRDTTDQASPRSFSSPPVQSEQPRRSLEKWDSSSRRLATTRARSPPGQTDRRTSADQSGLRHSDVYSYSRPSPISVSAASSALSSLTLKETAERQLPRRQSMSRQKTAPPQTPKARPSKDLADADLDTSETGEGRLTRRNTSSDSITISRRSTGNRPSTSKSKITPNPASKSTGAAEARARRRENRTERPSSPLSSDSSSSFETPARPSRHKPRVVRQREASLVADSLAQLVDSSTEDEQTNAASTWKKRKAAILKKLPPGVDEHAAKQILNEIVVEGDEVHWSDIAGLEVAKNALRETVVYPFLRPDLFMGLREPARGMLLFGPPGTGKTMLARAVATESRSTFFSISASSLTSKYLGESEKLVRALFALAKLLSPSIIFVDEIDSLLSQRSGTGEHEATRRIKTEFLIQWSDLQRAAAGREAPSPSAGEKDKDRGGDANRVLVLAATNLPWAIDEAARRRFVRRQYIPLPEAETRAAQLKTLLKQQKHTLSDTDIDTLVGLTDGFSGSDITALAKDAAMGPLRSLGEALLHMTMDEIRPIELSDFIASLTTIRPSVSKSGIKEYEDWAKEFGERGG